MDAEFLFENVSDPIVVVDRDFRVVRVNPGFRRFFGIGDDKALGKRSCDLFKELRFSRCNEACMKIIKKKEGGNLIEVPDEHCPHFDHAYPVFDEEGCLKEAMLILKIEPVRGRTRDGSTAHAQNRETDVMLATIYHDLAAPLQVIRASCDLMSMELDEPSGDNKDVMREMLEASKRNERRLYEMVRTIRLVPAMEEDEICRLQPVRLDSVVENVCSDYRLLLSKGVTLDWSVPSGIPNVTADPDLLDRVLFNLLDNAARYTQRGGHIRLTVEYAADAGQVTVRIFDDGKTIPFEVQARLFDKNIVMDSNGRPVKSRRDHGWGLYFCRLTIERFGGTIEVNSREGWGTEFSFTLTVTSSHKQPVLARGEH
jgi:signal transduction histidine kinase